MSERVVYVIDDDEDVRRAITLLLESVGLRVEACDSLDAFESVFDADRAGCVLADVRMPRRSGLELVPRFGAGRQSAPLIMISGHADVPMAVAAVRGGAFDFFEKPFNDQAMIDRVNAAIEEERVRRRAVDRAVSLVQRFDGVTEREWQVADRLALGETSAEAGRALGLSPRTIDMHRARIMRKVGASTVAELVALVVEHRGRATSEK